MKNPTGLAIFRAGTHTSTDGRTIEFSDADLAEIVASYNPSLAEAPLVVGHPSMDAPAYGWAKSLRVDGDVLYAEPHQVEEQFADLVNAGRMKKISASIYLRDGAGNPTPGKLYLRHIGFLGAQPPAVKGLPNAQFAEGDGAVEFSMPGTAIGNVLVDVLSRVRDWFVETQGAEKADQIISQWQLRSLDACIARGDDETVPTYAEHVVGTHLETKMDPKDNPVQFAEREQSLNARQTELESREQAIADREAATRRADAVAFADSLVAAGKLLPRHNAPVVELLLVLPAGTAINFAEGNDQVSKPGPDILRELLSSLPPQVNYAEKAGAVGAPATVEFAAPQGTVVDATRSDVYSRAKQFQAQNPTVDWLACVRAVGG